MGLLLMAGRVDPVLREATHAVEAELTDLRALRDAIPGDDKIAVAEWAVRIAAAYVGWADGHANSRDLNNVFFACPPSVRAALRSSGGGA